MIIVGRKSCLILVLAWENTYITYVLIFLHFFPFERSFQERKRCFFFRFYKLLIFLPSSLFLNKILVFGCIAGVGKSCLLLRFSDDTFNTSFITTIGFVHIDPRSFVFKFYFVHSYISEFWLILNGRCVLYIMDCIVVFMIFCLFVLSALISRTEPSNLMERELDCRFGILQDKNVLEPLRQVWFGLNLWYILIIFFLMFFLSFLIKLIFWAWSLAKGFLFFFQSFHHNHQ
mgnify:CR=1 FL=1